MNGYVFEFCKICCIAMPTGALHLPAHDLLCVSDLHLGKSERVARRSGIMLPPYDVRETLHKLEHDINATRPKTVICLGDSFDDLDAAASLCDDMRLWLLRLQAGRKWIWIEGNHDPGPVDLGGTHLSETSVDDVAFRHIATAAGQEISGHYHPKHRIAGRSRPAFLLDATRMIMPAYGAFTGGLYSHAPALRGLFQTAPLAVLTGNNAIPVPTAWP